MPTTIVKQIYMGKFEDLDPVEASSKTGNYNNDVNELQTVAGWGPQTSFKRPEIRLMDIAQNDTAREGTAGNNRLEENDFENAPSSGGGPGKIGADTITYDLGNGPVTSKLDSAFRWKVELTLHNGTAVQKDVTFIQLEDGAIFTNVDNADFANLQIKGIKLLSYISGSYYGTTGKRSLSSVQLLCFSADAKIRTPEGAVRAGDLQVGNMVVTRDHGAQPIRWITRREVSRAEMRDDPNLTPIRIAPNTFGPGLPSEPLLLSPQHRVLVRSAISQRMFGEPEALIAIKHMQGYPGIGGAEGLSSVVYIHFALGRHEVIFANELQTETLFPGEMVLSRYPAEDQARLRTIYASEKVAPARYFASRGEAQTFVRRHLKNRRPLIDGDSAGDSDDSPGKVLSLRAFRS